MRKIICDYCLKDVTHVPPYKLWELTEPEASVYRVFHGKVFCSVTCLREWAEAIEIQEEYQKTSALKRRIYQWLGKRGL